MPRLRETVALRLCSRLSLTDSSSRAISVAFLEHAPPLDSRPWISFVFRAIVFRFVMGASRGVAVETDCAVSIAGPLATFFQACWAVSTFVIN